MINTINTGSRILVTSDDLPEDTFNTGNIIEFDIPYGRYEIVGWEEGTRYFCATPLDEESKEYSIWAEDYDDKNDVTWFDHDGVIDGYFRVIRPDGSVVEHQDPWEEEDY